MLRLNFFVAVVALLSSAAFAQTQPDACTTEDPSCHGATSFGPAAVDRCLSIRGGDRTDFCQVEGQVHSVPIQSGDRYCAVLGSDPVPDACDLHWVVVTDPG